MALHRSNDGPEPDGHARAVHIERRTAHDGHLGTGTLACPRCDVPVTLATRTAAPADPLACPYCGHAAAVRDFLSLAPPTRPTRVAVRVLLPYTPSTRRALPS